MGGMRGCRRLVLLFRRNEMGDEVNEKSVFEGRRSG